MKTQPEKKTRANARSEAALVIRDVAQAVRRQIRYICFRIQGGTEAQSDMPDWSTPELVDAIRALVEGQDAFTSWDGFATEWDFGIDDVATMAARPEKWFAWGIPHTTAIPVPKDPPLEGLRRIVGAGFGKAAEWADSGRRRHPSNRLFADAGVVFRRSDYERILEGANERKGW